MTIGHNSKDRLKSYIERIETVNESIKGHQDDRAAIFAEAKADGFDVKIIRRVIAIRKQDAHKRQEEEAVLDTYLHALGMLAGTPLGNSALREAVSDFKDNFGEPSELTDAEKKKGVTAAFEGKNGRVSFKVGKDTP